MSGLALPGPGQRPPHASINPSALSRPPHSANQPNNNNNANANANASGSGSGSGTNQEGKDVGTAPGGKDEGKDKLVASVPEITVVEGLVPTLQ